MSIADKRAVVLMAYGSPENISDIDYYLQDIFGSNPVPPEARADNLKKYALFGNRSPSNHILASLRKKLESSLSPYGFDVLLAFKHWKPGLATVADEIRTGDYSTVVCVPLFPFPSNGVFDSYATPFTTQLVHNRFAGKIEYINGFYNLPGYADLWRARLLPEIDKGAYDVIALTAHSLPNSRSSEQEYKDSFYTLCNSLAGSTKTKTIYGFQSRSRYGNSWLEPAIQKVVLSEKGLSNLLAAPIGFCYEHLEVLYDLDIDFSRFLGENGISYKRIRLLNDDDDFVSFLSRTVKDRYRKIRS